MPLTRYGQLVTLPKPLRLPGLPFRPCGRTVSSAGPDLAGAEIVVNATPLGMNPDDPLPFRPDLLPPGSVVADIIMMPRETRLLRQAGALGHHVHGGIHMLDRQLDSYRAFFRLDQAVMTTKPRDVQIPGATLL